MYLVSRLGVTSAAHGPDIAWIGERIAQLRPRTARRIAVGFGISRPDEVRAVCRYADGAIVGSALVDSYAGTLGAQAVDRARAFLCSLRAATVREPES